MDMYAMLKKPFFGRYQRPWQWPEEVERDPWQKVEFETARGARLAGLHARTPSSSPKGTIICAHPMGTDAKGHFLKRGHAALLLRNGYNVFLFDFNGFGESQNDRSFDYPSDILAGAVTAQSLLPSKPLGLLGLSFGAGWVICALSRRQMKFRAAVVESAFTTLDEFWRPYRFPYLTLRAISVCLPAVAENLKPIAKVRDVTTDMLFIYGDKDKRTPVEMGERLLAGATAASSLWVVQGAEHTRALAASPKPYEERVVGFFDRAFA